MTNARVPARHRRRKCALSESGIDMQRLLLSVLLAASASASTASAADACLDQALQAHAFAGGAGQISIAALAPDGSRDTRVLGTAAPDAALHGNEGFRLASITKKYGAATALRLH